MAITDSFDTLYAAKTRLDSAFGVRAQLQSCRSALVMANLVIQGIVGQGQFNTLPDDVKNVLIAGWRIAEDAEAALSTGEINDVINWTP